MRPRRIPQFSYCGLQRYFLTICTENRRLAFVRATVVSQVLEQFRQSASRYGFAILAYCFMPDHLHLLVEGQREDADLPSYVSDAKQRTGFAYRRSTGSRLWQVGYFDHVLRDDDRVPAAIGYIIANPVRAGLAAGVGEYEFCGSDVYSTEEILASSEIWSPASNVTRRR